MKFIIFISLLSIFLGEPTIVNGGQVALRPRSKGLLSRSLSSSGSILDPTNEESFYTVGEDPNTVVKSIHQTSKRKYVNFEKFEDYLRPQERLCTPSPDNKSTILTFPLSHGLYVAARERWEGEENLVFIGHDPSCFAPEEERSSFKSLFIAFDDALQTIRVTGKPLYFGDKHFPAPTELIIGRAPGDVVLTRRTTSKEDHWWNDLWHCLRHPIKCARKIFKHFNLDFDSPDKHIDFNSNENEPRKKYWPPDVLKEKTGVPELFELYCLECRSAGGIDQEFHIVFNVFDNDHDQHHSRRNEDGLGDDIREIVKHHIKRAFVKYSVTEEIKIRKQVQIVSDVAADVICNVALIGTAPPGTTSCKPQVTVGGLQWEPGRAPEDKAGRAKAMGPKEVGDPKAGRGKTNSWGYSVWPMDVGIYVWMDFGIQSQVNMTLPGFEVTIPVGSELEIDVMRHADGDHIDSSNFDPSIEILKADLSIQSTQIHYNIAVGPKAGLNIGLPKGKVGLGFGARLDVVRVDNKLSEYKHVTSACTDPKEGEEAFENAFGFTMDLKTGLYAFLNIAGFYVDSNWIGDKVGSDFPGLYWGIKNLVAKCGDCGKESCVSRAVNEVLDVAVDGIGFIDGKSRVGELTDSAHVSKDSIFSLDNQMVGEDMPTGDPDTSCYAKPAPGISRREVFDHDKDFNICQPKQKARLDRNR